MYFTEEFSINEQEISREIFKLYDLSLEEQSFIEEDFT